MTAINEVRESDTIGSMRVLMQRYGDQGVLDTRTRGAEARWDIERQIAASGQTEALVLDFADVRAVTVPFVEECIGKLLAGRATSYYDDHAALALNANEDIRETIDVALGNRRLALLHASEPPMLLGGDTILNETLREAWDLKEFTAGEVGARLGISAQAANNRLKALVARGALRRSLVVPAGGGKEFTYSLPRASEGSTPNRAEPWRTPGRRADTSRRRRPATTQHT